MATSPRKIQGLAVLTINEDLVLGAALKMMNECKDFKVFHSIIFLTLPYLSLFTFFSLRVIFCLGSVYMCMEFRIYNVWQYMVSNQYINDTITIHSVIIVLTILFWFSYELKGFFVNYTATLLASNRSFPFV